MPSVIESPDGDYEVTISSVWSTIGVRDVEARSLPEETIIEHIRQAMVQVESASADSATAFAKKNAATALAAHSALAVDGEQLADSIQALDVEIQFDAQSRRESLDRRSTQLLNSLRTTGSFVRSSTPGSRLTDRENLSRPK